MQRFRVLGAGMLLAGLTLAYVLAWSLGSPLTIRSASARSQDSAPPEEPKTLRQRAFAELDRIRQDKKSQLTQYLQRIGALADRARQDELLTECFLMRLRHHQVSSQETPPDEALQASTILDNKIRRYCLEHYRAFSDVLFVDHHGEIFYCYHKMQHMGRCLLEEQYRNDSLSRKLAECPDRSFVSFSTSSLTGQACGFFVQPVGRQGDCVGWIVLQLGLDKINEIFVRDQALGQTGEAFLVSRNCNMLTVSRFLRNRTPLDLHLSPENILAKFEMGQGHKVVTDYRGFRAMSSFEVCNILGSPWLLVTKIDEAEVVTEAFMEKKAQLLPRLVEETLRVEPVWAQPAPSEPEDALTVQMDAFGVARTGQKLKTYGIRSCTGLVICLPGKFAYLGHASNQDTLYGQGDLDLLGHMLSRVRTFEIYPFQKRNLQVVLVAPHDQSLHNAVEKLLEAGYLLEQIRVLCNPQARSARIWHDVETGQSVVRWNPRNPEQPPRYQRACDAPHLGKPAGKLLGD
jgi:hypothetical protein